MSYLAIDPGYEKLGYCFFSQNAALPYRYQILKSGIIKTKRLTLEKRILEIFNKINQLVGKFKPKAIILEQVFFFKNQKTVIKVAMIHGVINLLASQKKISLIYLSPLEIKQIITGYGRADKKGVRKMLQQQIRLPKDTKEDDEVDAIACGLAYLLKSQQLNRD